MPELAAPALAAGSTGQIVSASVAEGLWTLTDGQVDLRGGRQTLARPPTASLSPLAGFVPESQPQHGFDADPAMIGEWWVKALDLDAAWEHSRGEGIVIADCDSGFYTAEPDLNPNLLLSERRDFADPTHPTLVTDGAFVFHGTAVAAIMVGVRDGHGTNGIAYGAKLVPLQNYNYDPALDGTDKEEATARCVLHALRIPGVRVIVVENQTKDGSSETFAATRDAIRLAIGSGVTVVAAAGNGSRELTIEAADDTGSIIVGALRRNGRAAIFSNYGARVTISAFGEGVNTLYGTGGRIESFGGTTAATAQVGGAVALMLSANPDLSPAQIRQILRDTANSTIDNIRVGGQLVVGAAVRQALAVRGDAQLREQGERLRDRAVHLLGGYTR